MFGSMILTITMNPSVDMSYPLSEFMLDQVNRAATVSKTAGGKGLNVTRVIHELGEKVMATGVLGGTLGMFILKNLEEQGIQADFLHIEKESRNCIAILHDGKQTEILEAGPVLDEDEGARFQAKLRDLVSSCSLVAISGSLPQGLPVDYYSDLIRICQDQGVPVLLDSSGRSLLEVLHGENKPHLIKPNQSELEQLLKREITLEVPELKQILSNELFEGIPWIVVSLGADGAFVKHEGHFYKASIPRIEVVNPVGSGDATIAGLAVSLNQTAAPVEVIKTAMTTGILNTLEEKTGHINRDNFEQFYAQVVVEEV